MEGGGTSNRWGKKTPDWGIANGTTAGTLPRVSEALDKIGNPGNVPTGIGATPKENEGDRLGIEGKPTPLPTRGVSPRMI